MKFELLYQIINEQEDKEQELEISPNQVMIKFSKWIDNVQNELELNAIKDEINQKNSKAFKYYNMLNSKQKNMINDYIEKKMGYYQPQNDKKNEYDDIFK